jgi:hypothetical protein
MNTPMFIFIFISQPYEALNMKLQGQRLTEYVNTKWEEMIHDWRAVMSEPNYAVAWEQFQTR